jgi:chemotaxis protein MotB
VFTILVGCGPNAYELQYPKVVDQNKQLRERNRSQKETILELKRRIDYLEEKMQVADEALVSENKQELAAGRRKQALLARLKMTLQGLPCEVERRGGNFVVITRFSFAPGKAELDASARSDLRKISKALRQSFPEAELLVAGHADKSPIRASGYESNWHLSGERARSVMEFLVNEGGVGDDRIAYAGYGAQQPIATNETAEGRQKNRRVEIVVKP